MCSLQHSNQDPVCYGPRGSRSPVLTTAPALCYSHSHALLLVLSPANTKKSQEKNYRQGKLDWFVTTTSAMRGCCILGPLLCNRRHRRLPFRCLGQALSPFVQYSRRTYSTHTRRGFPSGPVSILGGTRKFASRKMWGGM